MTKNKPAINKISDKLTKVGDSFTVTMYDNGFMFEIGGRNENDDWSNARLICSNLDDLVTLIMEAIEAERD